MNNILKDKVVLILSLISFICILSGSTLIISASLEFNVKSKEKTIKINDIEVPTIYSIIGYKKVCDYNHVYKNEEQIIYNYCKNLTEEDIDNYTKYLIKNENFELVNLDREHPSLMKEKNKMALYIDFDTEKSNIITYTSTYIDIEEIDKIIMEV